MNKFIKNFNIAFNPAAFGKNNKNNKTLVKIKKIKSVFFIVKNPFINKLKK